MDTWHTYGLPIIIAENGLADAGDVQRADFIVTHLRALKRAIDQGANVKGYFHWSLLDNYEWAEGYKMKFGLFSVDPSTLTRTPRESANVYAKICERNAIPVVLPSGFQK
jgi:beta-glucosidase/6-phospho-beta-glucosidase/beta-galactosidase